MFALAGLFQPLIYMQTGYQRTTDQFKHLIILNGEYSFPTPAFISAMLTHGMAGIISFFLQLSTIREREREREMAANPHQLSCTRLGSLKDALPTEPQRRGYKRKAANLVSDVTRSLEGDGLRDGRLADAEADGVVDRAQQQPRKQPDVSHAFQELSWALKLLLYRSLQF